MDRALRLSDLLSVPHPTGLVVAECLAILQFLVLCLASFFAAQALFSLPENRHRGLRDGAALFVAACGFGLLSAAFTAGVYFSDPNSQAYRIAGILEGVFLAGLMIAALLAAVGLPSVDVQSAITSWAGPVSPSWRRTWLP